MTGGGPSTTDYYAAGKTDLLVTWLYKLTSDKKDYSLASTIGILIFIISAALSLITYRNTKSYKEEDSFQ
jgi:arabinogalactan oligomer/maltooligosaccharide transport system permease protein